MNRRDRIAVIGAGMSGLTVARILSSKHEVTVYESSDVSGGHAHLVHLPNREGQLVPVDAGVCMFYTTAYPNFFRLLQRLKIPSQPSATSTEILCVPEDRRYHFDLNSPWKTLASSVMDSHQRWVLTDGLRFYRHATRAMRGNSTETFADHLASEHYCESFRVLLSFLGGATWTLNQAAVGDLPFRFVARTFFQLGFLPSVRHGTWHHIPGSVKRYLDALAVPIREHMRLSHRVQRVVRQSGAVSVSGESGDGSFSEDFDQVIFATPGGTALRCLEDASDLEAEILGAFRVQRHDLAFTSDAELMKSWTPNEPVIFAASDVSDRSMERGREFLFHVGFTDVTKMCGFDLSEPLYMWYQFPDGPRPGHVHAWHSFSTPRFTVESLAAQKRHGEISGRNRVHFCGAGWVNGIHEGSVVSALNVARSFQMGLDDIQTAEDLVSN